jgi:hypothetical protein
VSPILTYAAAAATARRQGAEGRQALLLLSENRFCRLLRILWVTGGSTRGLPGEMKEGAGGRERGEGWGGEEQEAEPRPHLFHSRVKMLMSIRCLKTHHPTYADVCGRMLTYADVY